MNNFLIFYFLLLPFLATFAVMSELSQKIDKSIAELLFNHNCVIIPGFGALVGNRVAANLDENKNTFYPPYKKLVFNVQLQMNDGLLVQEFSKHLLLSFEEAELRLNDVVKHWQSEFKKGKEVSIDKVGVFKRSKDRKIEFHQDFSVNYLLEAYGLQPIHVLSVQRDTIKEKITRQIIDSSLPSAKKERMSWQQVAAAVLLPAVAASALFLSINFKSNQVSQMNWNPFTEDTDTVAIQSTNPDVVINLSLREELTESKLWEKYAEKAKELKDEKLRAVADSTDVKIPVKEFNTYHKSGSKKYLVIAGCFASEENANRFLEEVKSAGFNAQIVGKTHNGLTRVAYGVYDTQSAALNSLSEARTKHGKDAWMVVE